MATLAAAPGMARAVVAMAAAAVAGCGGAAATMRRPIRRQHVCVWRIPAASPAPDGCVPRAAYVRTRACTVIMGRMGVDTKIPRSLLPSAHPHQPLRIPPPAHTLRPSPCVTPTASEGGTLSLLSYTAERGGRGGGSWKGRRWALSWPPPSPHRAIWCRPPWWGSRCGQPPSFMLPQLGRGVGGWLLSAHVTHGACEAMEGAEGEGGRRAGRQYHHVISRAGGDRQRRLSWPVCGGDGEEQCHSCPSLPLPALGGGGGGGDQCGRQDRGRAMGSRRGRTCRGSVCACAWRAGRAAREACFFPALRVRDV